MRDDLATIGFPFLETVSEPAIHLIGVGVELRNDKSYYFDNRDRNIDSFIFQYTLEGSGILEIGDTPHVLTPGTAFFTYVPEDTKYYCNPNDTHWKFIFVFFTGKSMMPYYEKVTSTRGMIFELDRNSAAVMRAFSLYEDAKNGHINDPLTAASSAFDFVCKLCASADSPSNYSLITNKAIALLTENFHRACGVSEIARTLNVSASHLSRVFTNDTGTTAIEYLTKIRINHALRRLTATDDAVDVIARDCGFDNGNYFCKVFKKHIHMTPTAYRKYRKL